MNVYFRCSSKQRFSKVYKMDKTTIAETVKRLTTENFTCTVSDETGYPNFIITYNLNSFPFSCSIPHYTIESKKTGQIFINHDSIRAVRDTYNLSESMFSCAKDRSENRIKYAENKIDEPSCVLLSKAEGSRLEAFYIKWFNYLSETEYTPLVKECENVLVRSFSARTFADSVLRGTTNTVEKAKSSHRTDLNITLKNAFGEMVIPEATENRIVINLDCYRMTDEMRVKLFVFLDTLENEIKK